MQDTPPTLRVRALTGFWAMIQGLILMAPDPQIALRSMLEGMSRIVKELPSDYYYRGLADFVLREGRFFAPNPLPHDIKGRPIKECYRNALRTAIKTGLRYAEGFALCSTGAMHLHAWNVTVEGKVVDTTWDPVGLAYLGVIFPFSLVRRAKGPLIDDWRNGFPILRNPLDQSGYAEARESPRGTRC